MQIGKDKALRLLVVDDSVEAAEAIVSGLRNAGIAVRPTRPENEDELKALLDSQTPDLVIVAHASTAIPLGRAMAVVDGTGKDVPVLILYDSIDDAKLLEASALGAHGVVLRDRAIQIEQVVRTEWTDLEARRALRRLENHVRETERRCDALIESSRDPIAYIHEGMHIRANSAYLEMFGFESQEDIEGMSLLDLVAPQHVEGFKKLLKSLSKGEAPPPRHELQARTLEGTQFPAVMEFTAATYEGEPCQQLILRRQETGAVDEALLEELRQRDQVTGLLNRQAFLRELEDTVADAAQNATQHGLMLVEPDHYARLVQDIGLGAADELVAACAERLRNALGPDDLVARFGEHQFGVLRRGADHATTASLAEQIRAAFADAVLEVGSHSLNITASIGGVQISQRIASMTAVLGKAAAGVQSAIGVGGNRVDLFDPGAVDRAELERMAAWITRIREALEGDGFLLHYQPLIGLHGEPREMYEGFLRLRGEHGEIVPPLTFLQIAEENSLMSDIDRWVVGTAISLIGERARNGHETTMLVKITEHSLQDDSLARHIEEQLAQHGVNGRQLVIEIPESKVFTHLRAAQAFQVRLARLGVRICLEQFGSGLNSFQMLTHFDAAVLKFDRAFMEDLPTNNELQARLRDMTRKAKDMGKTTIAEFVQDAGSMSILFGAGMDYAQGHFLAASGPNMDYEF